MRFSNAFDHCPSFRCRKPRRTTRRSAQISKPLQSTPWRVRKGPKRTLTVFAPNFSRCENRIQATPLPFGVPRIAFPSSVSIVNVVPGQRCGPSTLFLCKLSNMTLLVIIFMTCARKTTRSLLGSKSPPSRLSAVLQRFSYSRKTMSDQRPSGT